MEQATADAAREVAYDLYQVLLEKDAGTLGSLARGHLSVDDPLFGRWEGDGFAARFDECARWLHERSAAFVRGPLTLAGPRSVHEWTLYLADNGRDIELPVAVVAESDRESVHVRVYHSTWPLTGRHDVRGPLIPCERDEKVPDVVGEYQRALAAGDLEGVLRCFVAHGYAREPAGGPYVYRGAERLRYFYGALLASGGIRLRHCTLTDDGTRCAIEYVADRWGAEPMAPQAGVAVYEREGSGKLLAARIYDDVEPPDAADLSL